MTCKVAITQCFKLIATGTHLVAQGSMWENDPFGGNTMMRIFPHKKLNLGGIFSFQIQDHVIDVLPITSLDIGKR